MSRNRSRGQALVEFALVGPILLLVILVGLDFGRGIFYYGEIAEAAREAARQAVLQYNQDSNRNAPSCGACQVPGVVPVILKVAALGYPVVYANSASTSAPPAYPAGSPATYVASPCATPGSCDQPGTVTLAPGAAVNTVYVFIYELNPADGSAIWAGPVGSRPAPIRNGGHRKVVVDLQFRFQPVVLRLAGISNPWVLLDAQTVQREEYS